MLALMTLAQMRDEIRRKCGKVPLFDMILQETGVADPAAIGQPSPANPTPYNIEINTALDDATREINRRCHLVANLQMTYPVNAQNLTTNGPAYIRIRDMTNPLGQVQQIRRIAWNMGNNINTRLFPTSREDLDAQNYQYDNAQPGVPYWYWMESNQIAIFPAPSQNGTLIIVAGVSFPGFVGDNDILDDVPIDYQDAWLYGAVVELARRNQRDEQYAQALQDYTPKFEQSIRELREWKASTMNPEYTNSIKLRSYRTGTLRPIRGR